MMDLDTVVQITGWPKEAFPAIGRAVFVLEDHLGRPLGREESEMVATAVLRMFGVKEHLLADNVRRH